MEYIERIELKEDWAKILGNKDHMVGKMEDGKDYVFINTANSRYVNGDFLSTWAFNVANTLLLEDDETHVANTPSVSNPLETELLKIKMELT